jgi:hypothetical protein
MLHVCAAGVMDSKFCFHTMCWDAILHAKCVQKSSLWWVLVLSSQSQHVYFGNWNVISCYILHHNLPHHSDSESFSNKNFSNKTLKLRIDACVASITLKCWKWAFADVLLESGLNVRTHGTLTGWVGSFIFLIVAKINTLWWSQSRDCDCVGHTHGPHALAKSGSSVLDTLGFMCYGHGHGHGTHVSVWQDGGSCKARKKKAHPGVRWSIALWFLTPLEGRGEGSQGASRPSVGMRHSGAYTLTE